MVFLTLRVEHYEEKAFEEGLFYNIDQMEERKAKAQLRMLAYKTTMARLYNRKVCPRPIKVSDLVLGKTKVSDSMRS
ncbi:hypothetical protein B296_00047181 [Ensete ventricosum]|uniref:Uncharacterized protein n=1 Tax=Ensete ventricosum TaxID=4639 RepID=A0A426Z0S1_ENSVE|nr:hypothetical protein B296_00047181 [Ensete ventricosum]